MAKFEKKTTITQDAGVDEAGTPTQQQTKRITTDSSASGKSIAANFVWFILGLVLTLLGFRFVLKLFGANPDASFVDFIYAVSGVLTAPFDNIFGVAKTQAGEVHSVFEPSIIVAAAVYALIAWGIVKLMNINKTA